jgi:CRISPR-associated endonuclease Csy4
MGHYIEISLLPDPEFSVSVLLNALFAKLHRALVDTGRGEVGVSFPQARKTLGDKLRLHGNQSALQRLMGINWLKGLTDYTSVSVITPVPDKCQYRVVMRVQAKSNVERLYRRSVKKGWLTAEEADTKINERKDQQLKQPFVQLRSKSTDESFRLFIQQCKLSVLPVAGKFSDYGLSSVATVPWF